MASGMRVAAPKIDRASWALLFDLIHELEDRGKISKAESSMLDDLCISDDNGLLEAFAEHRKTKQDFFVLVTPLLDDLLIADALRDNEPWSQGVPPQTQMVAKKKEAEIEEEGLALVSIEEPQSWLAIGGPPPRQAWDGAADRPELPATQRPDEMKIQPSEAHRDGAKELRRAVGAHANPGGASTNTNWWCSCSSINRKVNGRVQALGARLSLSLRHVEGYLAHKKTPPP